MKTKILFILLVACFSTFSWERTYGGRESNRECNSIIQLNDSCYVLCGAIKSLTSSYLLYLLMIDQYGDTLWSKTYGQRDTLSSSYVQGKSIHNTLDGGFVATGIGIGAFSWNGVYLLKCDANGDSIWCKIYNLGNEAVGYDIIETSDAGFAVVATGTMGACIIKTDSSGDSLWAVTNDSYPYTEGIRLAETTDSGIIVAGANSLRAWAWKLNPVGSTIWYRTFYSEISTITKVIPESDGGAVLIGHLATPPDSLPTHDIFILKVNSDGDSVWAYTYRDDTQYAKEFIPSASRTEDGGIIIISDAIIYCSIPVYNIDSVYMYIVKVDSMGVKLWDKPYTPTTTNDTTIIAGWSVIQDYNGNYICASTVRNGWSYYGPWDNIYHSIILLKLDSLGNSVSSSISEYLHLPHKMQIYSYPNPFNSSVAIDIHVPTDSEIELNIFNISGQLVRELYSGAVRQGTHQFVWDGRDGIGLIAPSGLYYCKSSVSGASSVSKIVLVK
jgi:hypothetical protein